MQNFGIFCIYILYNHDDIKIWKSFLHTWPFLRGIHQLLVDFPYKGQVMQSYDVLFIVNKTICWKFKLPEIWVGTVLMWCHSNANGVFTFHRLPLSTHWCILSTDPNTALRILFHTYVVINTYQHTKETNILTTPHTTFLASTTPQNIPLSTIEYH